jgi:predicted CopG family antitoxin
MATKTITIDLEAYRRLKGAKQKNESFSQTIKRVVRPRLDFHDWMASIERDPLSQAAIDAVEQTVAQRREERNRRRPRGAA